MITFGWHRWGVPAAVLVSVLLATRSVHSQATVSDETNDLETYHNVYIVLFTENRR